MIRVGKEVSYQKLGGAGYIPCRVSEVGVMQDHEGNDVVFVELATIEETDEPSQFFQTVPSRIVT